MDLSTTTALVTGANRGIGRHLARELLARGATVYAGARRPGSVDLPGATEVALDITDPASVASAVAATGDVTLLVNNAGIDTRVDLLDGDWSAIEDEMRTNCYGTLAMTRAFVPQIEANGGGSVFNVLSALSWIAFPGTGAYCAAKSASWAMTNALRVQLAPRGIRVAGLHVGYVDTDMTAGLSVPKSDPADVARTAVDGIAAGAHEVLADDVSRQVQAGLAGGVAALYPQLP
ncbi:SDR family oxidoreductase [Modestobacter versicolor]|uniref:NAD(P)-dependent dehydrogenase (Short-subunit alcohol dehydrogenase family) n=1 Tax=Modestobacter versicolor TaxID=429133 RepID=A0A323VEG3_9ACTN|nr:SDR family oxidoreductase [Modestobacter versicolor]MBB3675172.1 NAD(P)-dependent dehydrogenase (short-subunit alcohol dehydrogenase family) [Modestobacter versicolor]PZA23009.1 short-chain dehydrogenase [Modestobacter versicolor]